MKRGFFLALVTAAALSGLEPVTISTSEMQKLEAEALHDTPRIQGLSTSFNLLSEGPGMFRGRFWAASIPIDSFLKLKEQPA